MKLLAIYGSPRKNGNSDILLNEALKGAKTTDIYCEKIFVRALNIKTCRGCRKCDSTGACVINDDMTHFYTKLERCERVIVSAPIFFYGLPSQLKALIDRSQAYWARKYLLKFKIKNSKLKIKRLGAFISVGATKGEKLFEGSKLTIKYFFDAFNIEYSSDLLVRSVDKKGEVKTNTSAMEDAYDLGKKLCEIQ